MRRNSRDRAFKLIYESLFVEKEFVEDDFEDEVKITLEEQTYANQIFDNYLQNKESLKERLTRNLKNYEFSRVYKIDVALVFLALTEILYLSVPVAVATNEVVELAKIYSTEKSPTFLNGLISSIIGEKND